MLTLRRCWDCREIKPLACFANNNARNGGKDYQCRICMNKRSKLYYEANKDICKLRHRQWDQNHPAERYRLTKRYLSAHPDIYSARKKVRVAQKNGTLVAPTHCECCGIGSNKLQGHHLDYSKPLTVTWLCAGCHIKIHKQGGKSCR